MSAENDGESSGTTSPIKLPRFTRNPWATKFGLYPSTLMESKTFCLVAGSTASRLFITRETVEVEQPACLATSRIDGIVSPKEK